MSWKNVQYKDGKMRTSEGGGGGGSSTFAGLDDVSFANVQNGQVPKYNSTTQKWENANESGGGGTVTDVQVDGVSVVNQQGVAEIEMPTPPTIPVEDVLVNGISVVDANNEAQIKSYKEVTQAEYDALPSSKISDGILYCIKDADGGYAHHYSTTEQVIGTWIDGKPLYEKTFYYASLPSSGECIFQTDIVVDNVVYMSGICLWYEYAFNIPHVSWDNGLTVDLAYNTQANDIRIHPNNNSFYTQSSNFYITVRYTKTTN